VYDLLKKKWFRKDTGTAEFPQFGFQVQDDYGTKYIYGGIRTGFLVRLENGTTWDGIEIEQEVETGDFWPSGNLWDLTRIKKIKFISDRLNEKNQVNIMHSSDTEDNTDLPGVWMDESGLFTDWSGGEWMGRVITSFDLFSTTSISRLIRNTENDNLLGWTHRFRFSAKTDSTTKGMQPLAWGIVFHKEGRIDE
jgi:hypothetical protein